MNEGKKYTVLLGDGMPDYPVRELNGKTPLEYARTPWLDKLAMCGRMGLARTVPDDLPPGSDVANLSVLGYDPARYYTGRSPLEAAGMGLELRESDLTFRCNLVTLSDEEPYGRKKMADYSAGEISSPEAAVLIDGIKDLLGSETLKFYHGVSYRHLLVWENGPPPGSFGLTPPHDISGQEIAPFLPCGEKGESICSMMERSVPFLAGHPINQERLAKGHNPANSIWLWGQGRKPQLKAFQEKYGLSGGVISAVDLIKGLGRCASLDVVDVPGATGNIHTNYSGKVSAALKLLEDGLDFVFVHIEAPDEAGHQGDTEMKIRAIEDFDAKVVGEMLRGMEGFRDFRLLAISDHPTPLSLRTHTREAVPFCIYEKGVPQTRPDRTYCEKDAAGELSFDPAYKLMAYFLM